MSTAGPVALPPPAVSEPGLAERIVRSPGRFCLAMLAITTLGLALDRYADLGGQMLLAACAWGFLAIAFVYLTPMERAQTSVVVVVATVDGGRAGVVTLVPRASIDWLAASSPHAARTSPAASASTAIRPSTSPEPLP